MTRFPSERRRELESSLRGLVDDNGLDAPEWSPQQSQTIAIGVLATLTAFLLGRRSAKRKKIS